MFKLTKVTILSLIGIVLLAYGTLLVAMTITEHQWLGSPPFHPAIDATSTNPQFLTLVDDGAASLATRLALIERAETSIDLEFFIYELDTASRIVTQALAEKARSGVAVRVLVDFSLPVFELRPAIANVLAEAGIEVRYYNTSSVARIFSVQHRTHRKILIIDNDVAMVGGRNIGNDYFDLSSQYNFLDSDIVIEGDLVPTIRESFDLYWHSEWSIRSDTIERSSSEDRALASNFLTPGKAESELVSRLRQVNQETPRHRCDRTRFVTDYPGAGVQYRTVYEAIVETLGSAEHTILAESPYFVLRKDGLEDVAELTERGIDVTVLTNSLHSTDAYYTVAPLYFSLDKVATTDLDLFAYSGQAPTDLHPAFPASERWGVHSKRAVVDNDTILIGTYNVDPRSANLNSELMIVCSENAALAAEMRKDIESRLARAEVVIDAGAVDSDALIGAASFESVAMMVAIAPVASLFKILL